MKKLMVGKCAAILFFEQEERELVEPLRQNGGGKYLRRLLKSLDVVIPCRSLYIELFENDGKIILFVSGPTAARSEPECRLYRFSSADELIDGIRCVGKTAETESCASELYAHGKGYYLLLRPPFPREISHLDEFADTVDSPAGFAAYLREYGKLLASPSALGELADRF